ncbi:MAG TPA: hypothetical protein VGA36_04850 [Nitriliruptorales bacterium]
MTTTAADVVALANRYLGIGSVVGFEQALLDTIDAEATAAGLPVRRGPGVVDLGEGSDLVLSAHADRHGLVRRSDGTFGYAAHELRDAEGETGHPSRRFLDRVCGRLFDEEVFAYDAGSGQVLARSAVPHMCRLDGALTVDIAGLDDVPAGTPVAFAHGCVTSGESLSGQLDNALGVAIAVGLVLGGDVPRALVTTREEVGGSAEVVVAHLADERPRLLVIDTSPFDDEATAARGAVVLRHADAGAAFDPGTTDRVRLAAQRLGIETVFKDDWIAEQNRARVAAGEHVAGLGRTELGRIIELTRGALTGTTVQVPTFDYHTNHETTTVAALEAIVAVLAECGQGHR